MNPSANLLTAAIDIGSSSMSLDIAEIHPDGVIRVLDSRKKVCRLAGRHPMLISIKARLIVDLITNAIP